jgi:hypothetical protein
MAKTIEVTATQVNAARLLVKQAAARGEAVLPAVAAMANATPLAGSRHADQADQQPAAPHTSDGSTNGRATAPTTKTAAQPTRPRFAG